MGYKRVSYLLVVMMLLAVLPFSVSAQFVTGLQGASGSTIPLPETKISVLAVPRSMPISRENRNRRKNTDVRLASSKS